MSLLSRTSILQALEALARELGTTETWARQEIAIAGGAALVLLYNTRESTRDVDDDVDVGDARVLLGKVVGTREEVWSSIEGFLVPGRELKARYAFEDLWESEYGS